MKPAKAKGESIQIRTYHSWRKLGERILGWQNILNENSELSIFTTPEWLGSWWKVFGSNKEMATLAFTNEGGELSGLTPLYFDRLRDPVFGDLAYLRLVAMDLEIPKILTSLYNQALRKIVQRPFTLARRSTGLGRLLLKWPTRALQGGKGLSATTSGSKVANDGEELRQCSYFPAETWQSYVEGLRPDFSPPCGPVPAEADDSVSRPHPSLRKLE